jgi:epoxyqueuosine reductase
MGKSSVLEQMTMRIVGRATAAGASLAGIASVDQLRKSPSHEIFQVIGMNVGAVGSRKMGGDFQIELPDQFRSVLVIAVSHPESKPELDGWQEGGTPGNSVLIKINSDVSGWIEETFGARTFSLPYHIEKGGMFLKDAAVLAGLGCLGKNNMLVTREFGPRVRLRAMLLGEELPPTGPVDFDPCQGCEEPCKNVCPQKAFDDILYSSRETGLVSLPGRSGCYDRNLCNVQMEEDIQSALSAEGKAMGQAGAGKQLEEGSVRVKYCRLCEYACPVGAPPKG